MAVSGRRRIQHLIPRGVDNDSFDRVYPPVRQARFARRCWSTASGAQRRGRTSKPGPRWRAAAHRAPSNGLLSALLGIASRGRPASAACALALAAGLALAVPPAVAQQPATPPAAVAFDIPAQALNAALLAFADRAGLQLVYDAGFVAGLRSAPLVGRFTAEEGLKRLLAGTGITFRSSGASTVTLEAVPAPEDSGPIRLQPIVVEGEKIGRTRDEAPPSISVIDGEDAERPLNHDIKSVIRRVPNTLAEDGIQLPAIRGIDGTAGLRQAFTAGTQPRVPILIDGVARPLSNAFAISRSSTWDVSTVEVARGPQPSSSGRNALAGAIRVYTNDPGFDYEAAARVGGYTADGTVEGAGMFNIPILSDQVAVRGTVEESRGESYVDVTDPTDFDFDPELEVFRRYRGKLRVAPQAVSGLELNFSVDYLRTEGPIPGFVDGDPDDLELSDFASQSTYEENDQTTYIGRASFAPNDHSEIELRGSFVDNDLVFLDTGAAFGEFTIDQDEVEGEAFLRLADLGFLQRGLIGVIHNRATEDGLADSPVFGFETDGEIENTGVYAEAELALGALGLPEGLTLIAGGRFEIDDRSRTVTATGTQASDDASFNEREFLPKLGLRYTLTDGVTLGYTYSESFRPGGVDVDLLAALSGSPAVPSAEFGPERLRQHEVYSKAALWQGRVELGASAFYYFYEDAQVPGASTEVGIDGESFFGNVDEARGLGLEIQAGIDIGQGFFLSGALGLLDTEITDAGPVLEEFEGEELPRAPNVTANVELRYESEAGFFAGAAMRFVGSTTSGLGEPGIDDYAILDLSAGYDVETQDGSFRIEAFVENVTDERYFTFREDNPTVSFEAVGRPRTFGLAATYRF